MINEDLKNKIIDYLDGNLDKSAEQKVEDIISSNDEANQNRLSIKVFVRFKNLKENDKSFEKSFNRFADFNSNIELSNIEEDLKLESDLFKKGLTN